MEATYICGYLLEKFSTREKFSDSCFSLRALIVNICILQREFCPGNLSLRLMNEV